MQIYVKNQKGLTTSKIITLAQVGCADALNCTSGRLTFFLNVIFGVGG